MNAVTALSIEKQKSKEGTRVEQARSSVRGLSEKIGRVSCGLRRLEGVRERTGRIQEMDPPEAERERSDPVRLAVVDAAKIDREEVRIWWSGLR